MTCSHALVAPVGCDQTIAVACLSCGLQIAVCWADAHIPESLWNRACASDPDAVRCDTDRDDVCAICAQAEASEKKDAVG